MNSAKNLQVGQKLGPFTVSAVTDDKVCLFDASAAQYRNAKSQKWLKVNSKVLAAIIARASKEAS